MKYKDWKRLGGEHTLEPNSAVRVAGKVYTHKFISKRKNNNGHGEVHFEFFRGCNNLNPTKTTIEQQVFEVPY